MPGALQIFPKHVTKYKFLRALFNWNILLHYHDFFPPRSSHHYPPAVPSNLPTSKFFPNPSGFVLLFIASGLHCFSSVMSTPFPEPSSPKRPGCFSQPCGVFQLSIMYFQVKFLTSFGKPLTTVLWRQPILDLERWTSPQLRIVWVCYQHPTPGS